MGRNNKHKRGARNKRGPVRSERRPSMTGRVQLHEHSAYVVTDNGDYKVMGRGKREIMDGDTVAVSIKAGPRGDRRAVIEGVIERAAISVVGTYQTAGPLGVIEPLDSRLKADFFILPEDTSAERLGVHPGDAVVARILTYPTRLESGTVTLERRIGGDDAPDLGVQYVMARYGYTDSYPEAALAEAEALSLDVTAALKDPLRRDLRDRFVITIDPVDARDFDDAISLERTPEGGYKLGVHIADVSHYVAWDGHIDLEARRRTTSVYLADCVLPMLPERLSCDLCSLRPDEDRLAFTVDIELDAQGRVRHYDPYPSVIRSRVRMDYDGAEALLVRAGAVEYSVLEGAAEDVAAAEASREEALERGLACEDAARGYNVDLADFLVAANELAERRRRIRRARGSVDFDTAEIRALLDENGVPVQIVARERSCATSLIEEAMLLANECVAEWLADRDIEACYRVHDDPSPDSLHGAAVALAQLGIIDERRAAGIALGSPDELQATVDAAAGTANAPLVNTLLLRSMQRALYKPRNEGHFALAAPCYCHFTSPIRRYPDLVAHRMLQKALLGEEFTAADETMCEEAADQSTNREQAADNCERDIDKLYIASYMQQFIGEEFDAEVSGVQSFGVFVALENGCEGLIRAELMTGDFYQYDEEHMAMVGRHTGKRFTIGTPMRVKLLAASDTTGQIDFAPADGSLPVSEKLDRPRREDTDRAPRGNRAERRRHSGKGRGGKPGKGKKPPTRKRR